MGELTHKAARAAFGGAIDFAMRKMDKDREKGLLDLVDLTEPICQNLDSALASMTIFDTSGIEAWVT